MGINLNNRLDFDTPVTNICNRLSNKLHALARISQYMSIHKRTMTMKAFIASEFGYDPLVWMFHSRKLKSQVNKLHERALWIFIQDYASSFTKLLEKDNSTTIHNRNIQLLPTELFQVKIGLSPLFMNEIFVETAHHYYDLRIKTEFKRNNVKTVYNGTKGSYHKLVFYNMPFSFYAAYFIIFKSHFYFVNFKSVLFFIVIF